MTVLKLGSLFDGIGVFPLAAMHCGMEPVWASEIEARPISITQTTFPGYAALGRHYKDQRCGDTAGRCDYIRFALSGLVADWHEERFCG